MAFCLALRVEVMIVHSASLPWSTMLAAQPGLPCPLPAPARWKTLLMSPVLIQEVCQLCQPSHSSSPALFLARSLNFGSTVGY
eukprot:754179-Hanusia_phi.AAC.1